MVANLTTGQNVLVAKWELLVTLATVSVAISSPDILYIFQSKGSILPVSVSVLTITSSRENTTVDLSSATPKSVLPWFLAAHPWRKSAVHSEASYTLLTVLCWTWTPDGPSSTMSTNFSVRFEICITIFIKGDRQLVDAMVHKRRWKTFAWIVIETVIPHHLHERHPKFNLFTLIDIFTAYIQEHSYGIYKNIHPTAIIIIIITSSSFITINILKSPASSSPSPSSSSPPPPPPSPPSPSSPSHHHHHHHHYRHHHLHYIHHCMHNNINNNKSELETEDVLSFNTLNRLTKVPIL